MGTELELFESELVTDARWTDRQTDRQTDEQAENNAGYQSLMGRI